MRFSKAIAIAVIGLFSAGTIPSYGLAGQTDGDSTGNPVLAPGAAEDRGAAERVVRSCLDSPTRRCALASALTVIAEERLAIVRVDALLAVAETLARLGQQERAEDAAELARTAAEDIGITFGIERKLAELAPVWALLGRDDKAMAIADRFSDRYLKANTLGAIAVAQAESGRFEAAQKTIDAISEPLLAVKYALEVTATIAQSQTPIGDAGRLLEQRLDTVEHKLFRGLGLAQLALIQARAGNAEKARSLYRQARDLLPYLTITAERARLSAALARVDLALGDRAAYEPDVARAATLAERVEGDFDQMQALSEVVASLAAGGRAERALALASGVPSLRGKSALIKRLAGEPGTEETVRRLAEHILAELDAEEARSERDRARLAVATALTRIGAVERAAAIIRAMEQRDTKARALAVLARGLQG